MAMKANASSQGGNEFKRFIGVGSFRVLGVNPTKAELEEFLGREVSKEPVYLVDKKDAKDNDKPYKQLRVTYMIQADADKPQSGEKLTETMKTNAALDKPFKTTISFFLDSRYMYNSDKTKVQVIDKYGRTAWCTIEQAKNHQIPVYSNGPAKLDKDYRPVYHGEENLLSFVVNYLNVTPIEQYNSNTGAWITNPHPEDCEAGLYHITDYFKGDIRELKEHCSMMPNNCIKLCVGVQTDDNGNQYNVVYSGCSLRNGSKSYTYLRDTIAGDEYGSRNTTFSDDPTGLITNIHEYTEKVQETDLSASKDDPFAAPVAENDDLPFAPDSDPFANVA